MGEALIVRRGGGGGGAFSLEKVEVLETWGGSSTSSALEPSKTYTLSVNAASCGDDGEGYVGSGIFVLSNGTISVVYDGHSFKNAVSFNPTTNKVTVKTVGNNYGSRWENTQLVICKVN